MTRLDHHPLPRAALSPSSNDYHHLPVSEKQLRYARQIASRAALDLPADVQRDRRAMSAWIDAHRPKPPTSRWSSIPSSKQIAFAEHIARIRHRQVPPECFRDKLMMSRWIDYHR